MVTTWVPDVLGDGYQQLTIPLGKDPDGEGEVEATLVRYQPTEITGTHAVLYVHGFTDYFFQQHLAEHFAEQGYSFFALDLRKCGRALRPGQTPHFVTDLRMYDFELNEALRLVREQISGGHVLLVAHSTGGLILPLWLDRLERRHGGSAGAGVAGVILNSPWFDLHGPAVLRSAGTSAAIDALGRVSSKRPVPLQRLDTYGSSLHVDANGEWEYDLDWKPLTGFPITFGWLRAIRRGHARLHQGLDVGVPSLILRSKQTVRAPSYHPTVDEADAILDVDQIARWAGCLGNRTTIVPIEGARHDVFLSTAKPLADAFHEVDLWLAWLHAHHLTDTETRETGASA
ncbi:alpha/beta hydrolase [Rhodococcus xishaensis]|uniref:Alpha/beta hydrolase n=1 Tax=Rhodococcus xishaensis TaxID=2487364 RepID=A0A3S3AG69_9NOCA|nr:alpha/beta hydrolase [Rhodococcus xishaensis]